MAEDKTQDEMVLNRNITVGRERKIYKKGTVPPARHYDSFEKSGYLSPRVPVETTMRPVMPKIKITVKAEKEEPKKKSTKKKRLRK